VGKIFLYVFIKQKTKSETKDNFNFNFQLKSYQITLFKIEFCFNEWDDGKVNKLQIYSKFQILNTNK
jgi:hypothetical protein